MLQMCIKALVCNVHSCMHAACQYSMHAYVQNEHAGMKCACTYKVCAYVCKNKVRDAKMTQY
jgi:hypothetical protein